MNSLLFKYQYSFYNSYQEFPVPGEIKHSHMLGYVQSFSKPLHLLAEHAMVVCVSTGEYKIKQMLKQMFLCGPGSVYWRTTASSCHVKTPV